MTMATREAYRFSSNATSSMSNEYGNYLLKRGTGEVRKPSWNRTDTVVRLLPQWDFLANEWSPFRRSVAPFDFGDWIRCYDAVRGFGENGITMFLYDPVANPAYDIKSNPCVILYNAIKNAIKNRQSEPDWPALFEGGTGRRVTLGRHGPLYIARCSVFRIKSKDMASDDRSPLGMSPGDPAFFFELPKSAGEKLINMLEEKNESFAGDHDDYDNYYKSGDIVSLDKGAYVTIFEDGADPRSNSHNANSPRQLHIGGTGRSAAGGSQQFKGYDMFISKTWNGYPATLNTPEFEKLIKAKQRPWEECLQFFSHQEQAHLVQDGFPASAILYAWRDHPEWIKDETRAKAVNRVTLPTEGTVRYQGNQEVTGRSTIPAPRETVSAIPETLGRSGVQVDQGTKTPVKVGGWGAEPATDTETTMVETADSKSREVIAQAALKAAKERAKRPAS